MRAGSISGGTRGLAGGISAGWSDLAGSLSVGSRRLAGWAGEAGMADRGEATGGGGTSFGQLSAVSEKRVSNGILNQKDLM